MNNRTVSQKNTWHLVTMIWKQYKCKKLVIPMTKIWAKNQLRIMMMKKRKLQNDILCSIQDMPAILKSWILLDSQSRVDMFSNPRLSNIQETKRTLKCYCTVL